MQTKYNIGQTLYYENSIGEVADGVVFGIRAYEHGTRYEFGGCERGEEEVTDNLVEITGRLLTKERERHSQKTCRILESGNALLPEFSERNQSEASCATATSEDCSACEQDCCPDEDCGICCEEEDDESGL